ncbi:MULTISPECIES: hypothetical protein [unclassified Nocardioides]|uniref:hypothetical protein n=1 Tax=unclassified Nocardioides TaxID=2615069 RepID=UPI0007028C55|nr:MULTISPECIES: hypothetical protein [unclassified Nocardioides]KRC48979.1 hypothetical protein ASE19_18955 [Nocardioides sp. Root79]KRC75380.1 hypothetical protein ASE20_20860 [Nocardioides sp. Root240]
MRSLTLATVVPLALALAACGSDEPSGDAAPTDARTSASSLPGRMVEHADASGCEAERTTVETAAEAYFASNGAYPADLAALEGDFLADVSTLVYVIGIEDGVPLLRDDAPC